MKDDYAKLSQSTLQVTKFDDTLIQGTIDCKEDVLMYTSIPQNGNNWHVYVDGKEAPITLIGNAMIGVQLTQGSHNIEFRYVNNAFNYGMIISISCAVIFSGICVYCGIRKRRKKAMLPEATQTPEDSE
jgi:uncharacterized membrane protein YfhO